MQIKEFQDMIEKMYFERDSKRGVPGSFMWFTEEVGELSEALMRKKGRKLEEEFADVAAWLFTLASISGVDMEKAIGKYKKGCPRCRKIPCRCKGK